MQIWMKWGICRTYLRALIITSFNAYEFAEFMIFMDTSIY